MLETLDSIPWSELEHAYGEASEVPDLIRALASPKEEIYKGALRRLWHTVAHQGTVYSSTAYVVPFFCELLEASEVQNKTELLAFLEAIAHGAPDSNVHILNKERRETPEVQLKIIDAFSWVQNASDAVSDGYATYLRLLQAPDEKLRAWAAYTLSRCQSHRAKIVPDMQQSLSTEAVPFVCASLLLSLGQLLEKSEETALFFTGLLQEAENPLGQIATAMGWAFAMREQTSQDALRILLQGYELSSDVKERFNELPFAESDLATSISIALLCFVFGDLEIARHTTISDLSDLQRDVLTTVYENEDIWEPGRMDFAIGAFFGSEFAEMDWESKIEDLLAG
jgi:hypothetical protein